MMMSSHSTTHKAHTTAHPGMTCADLSYRSTHCYLYSTSVKRVCRSNKSAVFYAIQHRSVNAWTKIKCQDRPIPTLPYALISKKYFRLQPI